MTLRLVAIGSLLALTLGCTHGPPAQGAVMTMPSPDGCYAQVWEQPDFTGPADFVNGPRRYANLRDMPDRHSWSRLIRSVVVGPTANVTVWVAENFQGASLPLRANSRHPQLPDGFAGRVKALSVECLQRPVTG